MKTKYLFFNIVALFAFSLGACSNALEQNTSYSDEHSSTNSYLSSSFSNHNHVINYKTVILKEPTCTELGSNVYITYCSECKAELSSQLITIPALGHDFVFYSQANYITDGEMGRYICKRCGYAKPYSDYIIPSSSATPFPSSSEAQYSSSEASREESSSSSSRRSRSSSSYNEIDNLPNFEVKIDKKDDSYPIVTSIKQGQPIDKPVDPVAPAGKTFYGWMNIKNGGQIWNFDDEWLNAVYDDVELEPLFIDNSFVQSRVEAELAPIITEANNGEGLDGATYSGGQRARGLIYKAYDGELNIEPMYINDVVFNDDSFESIARYANGEDPVNLVYGAFVHFFYIQGNKLTYVIECNEAIENAVMFMKIASEYGNDDDPNDVKCTFTDQMFPIIVNGAALQYGTVTVHGIVPKDFMPFQDYLLSTSVCLQQGTNVIEMEVNNNVPIYGTIDSTAPMIDCLKIYAPSAITCVNAKMDNLNKPL